MARLDATPEQPVPSRGQHLANLSHGGRIWDVFLEFEPEPPDPRTHRALLCFAPSDLNAGESATRTTYIIVEASHEAAVRRAKGLEERQLVGLLRSTLPTS
jgi:hypothetical protein